MDKKALFDPGFAPFVYSFSDNILAINQVLASVKSPQQRKFKFKMLQPQIISLVENNISFYLGCLMWAKYLKDELKDKEIVGNSFLGFDFEAAHITEDKFCEDINLLIAYFDRYVKDTKFYLGKESQLSDKWLEIATIYKEFLLLNKSFVKTALTNDLILPENISQVVADNNELNKNFIDKAINEKNLAILLRV